MVVERYAIPGALKPANPKKAPRLIRQISRQGLRGRPGGDLKLTRQVFGPELSPSELRTWKTFLPMEYSLRKGNFLYYRQEEPGDKTVGEIATAANLGVFQDIIILTPEGRYSDPLALGVFQASIDQPLLYFPIARWGESLASYRQVQWMVRWIKFVRFTFLVALFALACILFLIALEIGAYLWELLPL